MWNFLKRFHDPGEPTSPTSAPTGEFVREFVSDGYVLQVDESRQTLKIHAEDDPAWEPNALSPTLSSLQKRIYSEKFTSASTLAYKAKQFDDGLYAAVDLAAQYGAGKYPGKISLLSELSRLLVSGRSHGEMSALLFAAARLGNVRVEEPASMQSDVTLRIQRFLADENASKVLGFYTWTEELAQIFQQDRMLQSAVRDLRAVQEVAHTLHQCEGALATYVGYLTLLSRLTNAFAAPDLRNLENEGPWHFFPPSRAYETDLVMQLYGSTPIPEGFSLVQEMVQQIRDGRLSVKPSDKSGWYDYQTWALESLVAPERTPQTTKLTFSKEYREHLLELFKGVIALTRETHVKQLDICEVGTALPLKPARKEIFVRPSLSLEPLATFYGRRAIAYGFILEVLLDTFGPDGLKNIHRMTPQGPMELPLEDEIGQMIALFRGAHACVNRQLALPPNDVLPQLPGLAAAISTFQNWANEVDKDPDLGRDTRMMVPVFYDVERKKNKVWVVLGWAKRPLIISYVTPPTVQVKDTNGRPADHVDIGFTSQYEFAAYPISAEVYVNRLLNREEFQKHCDRYGTTEKILANLT
jgi:hypothetical protein